MPMNRNEIAKNDENMVWSTDLDRDLGFARANCIHFLNSDGRQISRKDSRTFGCGALLHRGSLQRWLRFPVLLGVAEPVDEV